MQSWGESGGDSENEGVRQSSANMSQIALLAKTVRINHDAARQAAELAAKLRDATTEAETANRGLRQIASRIEYHAGRSKRDFAVLAVGMAVAALVAGAEAVYLTKQNLDTANCQDGIGLIRNDTQAFWCERAGVRIVQDASGGYFCPVRMGKYQSRERGGVMNGAY